MKRMQAAAEESMRQPPKSGKSRVEACLMRLRSDLDECVRCVRLLFRCLSAMSIAKHQLLASVLLAVVLLDVLVFPPCGLERFYPRFSCIVSPLFIQGCRQQGSRSGFRRSTSCTASRAAGKLAERLHEACYQGLTGMLV